MKITLILAGACALLASACSTLQGPSLLDEGKSPRKTTAATIAKTIEVVDKLTIVASAGALPDNFADDVVQYAGDAERVATGYLDATEACVVIDGALQSDPATGRTCEPNTIRRAFGDVSGLLQAAVGRAGGVKTDAGRFILLASLFVDDVLKPAPGGVISGYEKTADLTREEFIALRGSLKTSFDRFVAAAAASPKKR